MQISGEIKSVSNEEKVSEKFKKREFVLITEKSSQYPQTIALELQQDKCDLIDPYSVGDEVIVDFNIKGRQFVDKAGKTKTFNTLAAWKIQPLNK